MALSNDEIIVFSILGFIFILGIGRFIWLYLQIKNNNKTPNYDDDVNNNYENTFGKPYTEEEKLKNAAESRRIYG